MNDYVDDDDDLCLLTPNPSPNPLVVEGILGVMVLPSSRLRVP